jgi:hypothetical protein
MNSSSRKLLLSIILGTFLSCLGCGALTEISITDTQFKSPIIAKNSEEDFRGFFFDSSDVLIPRDYLADTWENHVGSSIRIAEGQHRVLFIDLLKKPVPGMIDEEFGYKLVIQFSPGSDKDTIYFSDSSEDSTAIAHYFRFGPGSVHCWWIKPNGKLSVTKTSPDTLAGELDLVFVAESSTKQCQGRSVSFRGKFSVPKRSDRKLFR